MQAITSVKSSLQERLNSPLKSSRDEDESVFQSNKGARFLGQEVLDTAIAEQVQGIRSSLRKSRVSDMEEAIEALVKAAFELREHIRHQLPIPESFDQTDDQITCNVRGHSLKYDQRTQKITFIVLDRLLDFDSLIVTCFGKENQQQAQSIHDYVVANKACFCREAQDLGSDIYKRPVESGIDRALQFTKTGDVFIHFNRKKQRDELIGDGTYKTVVKAMNLATGQFFASASFKKADDPEIGFLEKFQGVEGIVQMHHSASYDGKDGSNKKRVILELYNEGDLFRKLRKEINGFRQIGSFLMDTAMTEKMTLEDKKQIVEDLVGSLAFLHREEYVHRDIKTRNIFLFRQDKDGALRAVLGDLGLMRHSKKKESSNWKGTPKWFSPELAKFALFHGDKQLLFDDMKKHDVWALGLVFRFLLESFDCPWFKKEINDKPQQWNKIIETPEWPEPEDKVSPFHLAWRMMRKDPKERISAQEALEQLPYLQWS